MEIVGNVFVHRPNCNERGWSQQQPTFVFTRAAQLFSNSLDQFSRRLMTAGLASNVTVSSFAPIDGHTLEAQMRALNNLPVVNATARALSAGDPFVPLPPPSVPPR